MHKKNRTRKPGAAFEFRTFALRAVVETPVRANNPDRIYYPSIPGGSNEIDERSESRRH